MTATYRIAARGPIPRRHEAAAAAVAAALPVAQRHALDWAVLVADDGATADVLLLPEESRPGINLGAGCQRIDLSTIPAERILARREAPHA